MKNRHNLLNVIILSLSLVATAMADESELTENRRPHWSIDFKVGKFTPELDRWEELYGDDDARHLAVGFSYKFLRSLELGAELAYIKDEGVGVFPLSGIQAGNVTHQLFPLHVYVLYRAIFNENQLFIPYAGVGYTRTYYRQAIEAQNSSRGDTDGTHMRYGLQILLDRIDSGGSAAMEEHNVTNSYLTIEVQDFSADIDGVELGGESLTFGFLFEF